MYIKSQVSNGHTLQKIHGDELYIRKDVIHPGKTCSDVAYQDIWGANDDLHFLSNPITLFERVDREKNEDDTFSDADGSFVVIVVYFLNEHGDTQVIVCDSVVYILSNEGSTLDIHRA